MFAFLFWLPNRIASLPFVCVQKEQQAKSTTTLDLDEASRELGRTKALLQEEQQVCHASFFSRWANT